MEHAGIRLVTQKDGTGAWQILPARGGWQLVGGFFTVLFAAAMGLATSTVIFHPPTSLSFSPGMIGGLIGLQVVLLAAAVGRMARSCGAACATFLSVFALLGLGLYVAHANRAFLATLASRLSFLIALLFILIGIALTSACGLMVIATIIILVDPRIGLYLQPGGIRCYHGFLTYVIPWEELTAVERATSYASGKQTRHLRLRVNDIARITMSWFSRLNVKGAFPDDKGCILVDEILYRIPFEELERILRFYADNPGERQYIGTEEGLLSVLEDREANS